MSHADNIVLPNDQASAPRTRAFYAKTGRFARHGIFPRLTMIAELGNEMSVTVLQRSSDRFDSRGRGYVSIDMQGVQMACGVAAGIKKNGDIGPGIAGIRPARRRRCGVYHETSSRRRRWRWTGSVLRAGVCRAVIVNAGNANCANGEQGMAAARTMTAAAARALGIAEDQVLAASTGVIGAPFPTDKVESAVPDLVNSLNENGTGDLALAIMTTDTRPKTGGRQGEAEGIPYRIVAVAKGSGMIRPDMATMLCFVWTDAEVAAADLQTALNRAVDGSFNCITIDGDTSTNDTVILMANGASGARIQTAEDLAAFQQLVTHLCRDLARQMVRDGEGASLRWST